MSGPSSLLVSNNVDIPSKGTVINLCTYSPWRKVEKSTVDVRRNVFSQRPRKSSPSVSVGMILCSKFGDTLKYGLVKRKSGYGLYKILKVNFSDTTCFTEISMDEQQKLLHVCEMRPGYKGLYVDLWNSTMFGNDIRTPSVLTNSFEKFLSSRELIKQHILENKSIFPFGIWGFPKGKNEGAETDLVCALREVREETGISSDEIAMLPLGVQKETFKSWHYRYYVGRVENHTAINRKINKQDVEEVVWVSCQEALALFADCMFDKKKILINVEYDLTKMLA